MRPGSSTSPATRAARRPATSPTATSRAATSPVATSSAAMNAAAISPAATSSASHQQSACKIVKAKDLLSGVFAQRDAPDQLGAPALRRAGLQCAAEARRAPLQVAQAAATAVRGDTDPVVTDG